MNWMKPLIRVSVAGAWVALAVAARGAIQYARWLWDSHQFQRSVLEAQRDKDFVLLGGSIEGSPTPAILAATLLTLAWLALTVFIGLKWYRAHQRNQTDIKNG